MTMYVLKNDVPDENKYWYKEFKKLYGYDGREYSLKIILLLIKQYYECAIVREKCRVSNISRVGKSVESKKLAYDDCLNDVRRGV